MNELHIGLLLLSILALTLVSAYFSGSETAMTALNRYRLRHLVGKGHRGARKADRLLAQPERLRGVVLIGSSLANFLAASIATVIGMRLLGDTAGVFVAPVVLTIFVLVFAEATPKRVAAGRPEPLALASAHLLGPLLAAARPVIALVDALGNLLAKPMTAGADAKPDALAPVERGNERPTASRQRHEALLHLLNLEKVTVDDIMVPRADIAGIDINDDGVEIVAAITNSQHTLLPVYREHVNDVVGVLHLRRAARLVHREQFAKADLMRETEEPYFVPQGTPLHTQLFNFQQHKRRIALVVDEYGDVQGLVTLGDLLEEIVGEFTTDYAADLSVVVAQSDGSHVIEGRAVLRDVNRQLGWELPTEGPRTLNGLILEHLEFIPESNVCLTIDERFRVETLQISDNVVRTVKVTPVPPKADAAPGGAV